LQGPDAQNNNHVAQLKTLLRKLDDSVDMLSLVGTSLCTWVPGAVKPTLAPDFSPVFQQFITLIVLTVSMQRARRGADAAAGAAPAAPLVSADLVQVRSHALALHPSAPVFTQSLCKPYIFWSAGCKSAH
jgi:hypothetical protein